MLRFVAELMALDVLECCTAFKGKENLDLRKEMNTAKHRCENLERRETKSDRKCLVCQQKLSLKFVQQLRSWKMQESRAGKSMHDQSIKRQFE
jgi:hypothetical protein